MTNQEEERQYEPDPGVPGGGKGRTDVPGRTGVYPGSGPYPPSDAPIVSPGSFGQGDRGPAGYEDSGSSSLEGIQDILRQQQEQEGEENSDDPSGESDKGAS